MINSITFKELKITYGLEKSSDVSIEIGESSNLFYNKLLDIYDSLINYILDNNSSNNKLAKNITEKIESYHVTSDWPIEASLNLLSQKQLYNNTLSEIKRYDGISSENNDYKSIENYINDESYLYLPYLISFFGIFNYTDEENDNMVMSQDDIKKSSFEDIYGRMHDYYYLNTDSRAYRFLKQVYIDSNDQLFEILTTGKFNSDTYFFTSDSNLKNTLKGLIESGRYSLYGINKEGVATQLEVISNGSPIIFYIAEALVNAIDNCATVLKNTLYDFQASPFFNECIGSIIKLPTNKYYAAITKSFDSLLISNFEKYKKRISEIVNNYNSDTEEEKENKGIKKRCSEDEELQKIEELMIGSYTDNKNKFFIYPSGVNGYTKIDNYNESYVTGFKNYIINNNFDLRKLDKYDRKKSITYSNEYYLYSNSNSSSIKINELPPYQPFIFNYNFNDPGQNILGKLLLISLFSFSHKSDTNTGWKPDVHFENTYYCICSSVYQFDALIEGDYPIKIRKQLSENDDSVNEYTSFTEAIPILWKLVHDKLEELKNSASQEIEDTEIIQSVNKSIGKLSGYVKNRLGNFASEKDFFYLQTNNNKKSIPNNPFVDIDFSVPVYRNNQYTKDWVSVTSIRSNTNSGLNSLSRIVNVDTNGAEETIYAGSYFSSFELNDLGSSKKITLILKSPDDCNLERIIENSLSASERELNITSENGVFSSDIIKSDSDLMQEILETTSANFRIRFGYRDKDIYYSDSADDSVIYTDDFSSNSFLNRTKKTNSKNDKTNIAKPVMVYPWSYFKITNIQTSIINNENTYTIEGVDVGDYILSSMSLSGCATSFQDNPKEGYLSMKGTPKNVLGTIAGYIYNASNHKICVLGNEDGKIITGYNSTGNDDDGFLQEATYTLSSDGSTLSPSDLGIEKYFYVPSKNFLEEARNFEVNSNTTPAISISGLLSKLTSWLPTRFYYVSNGDTAVRMAYEDVQKLGIEFYNSYPHVSESIKYQVIRAHANITSNITETTSNSLLNTDGIIYLDSRDENTNSTSAKSISYDDDVFFIRFYFEGPGIISSTEGESIISENKPYLRVYNYKNYQNQIIKNININNGGLTLGNIMSAVTVYNKQTDPLTFIYDPKTKKQASVAYNPLGNSTTKMSFESLNKGQSNENTPYLTTSSITFTVSSKEIDQSQKTKFADEDLPTNQLTAADAYFSSLCSQAYTGDITLIGDPFYYFDSSMEPAKYEIYLNMNRTKDFRSSTLVDSYFSGIYRITGITHSISGEGNSLEYNTKLTIAKYVF